MSWNHTVNIKIKCVCVCIFYCKKLQVITCVVNGLSASHKSNPSSVPRGIMDSYSTLLWVMWDAVTVVVGTPLWGLLRHMLVNGALVYPSQGGRYRAEGCMALWWRLQCHQRSPWGTRTHPIVCRPSVHVGLHGRWPNVFPVFCGRAPYWGLWHINEGTNHWLRRWIFSLHGDPVEEHGGGFIYQGLWGKGVEESSGDSCLSSQGPVGEPGESFTGNFRR